MQTLCLSRRCEQSERTRKDCLWELPSGHSNGCRLVLLTFTRHHPCSKQPLYLDRIYFTVSCFPFFVLTILDLSTIQHLFAFLLTIFTCCECTRLNNIYSVSSSWLSMRLLLQPDRSLLSKTNYL